MLQKELFSIQSFLLFAGSLYDFFPLSYVICMYYIKMYSKNFEEFFIYDKSP